VRRKHDEGKDSPFFIGKITKTHLPLQTFDQQAGSVFG
jgi:hypothetical protein